MSSRLITLVLAAPLLLHAAEPAPLPAYLLQLPASVETVLVAETSTATLHRLSNGAAGLRLDSEGYMSIGERGAGKQRAWDRRTPLGIYFVNEQLDTSKLHEKYGPTAFPLDYPNVWDRRNERSGDGIWIHGVAPGDERRPPHDTDGCIALPNDELLALAGDLVPLSTPVIIAHKVAWVDAGSQDSVRAELARLVYGWAESRAQGDTFQLLSYYAEDFRYRGMNRQEWGAFRARSIDLALPERIELDDMLLLADPETDGLYLSRFTQRIVYGDREVTTIKRLYWRRNDNGVLLIVAEDNG